MAYNVTRTILIYSNSCKNCPVIVEDKVEDFLIT